MHLNYLDESLNLCSLEIGHIEKPLYLLNPHGDNFKIQYFDGEMQLQTHAGVVNIFEWMATVNLSKDKVIYHSSEELRSIGMNMLTKTYLADCNGRKYAYAKNVELNTGEALGFKPGDSIFKHYGVKVVIDDVTDTIYGHVNAGRLIEYGYRPKFNIIIHHTNTPYHLFSNVLYAS